MQIHKGMEHGQVQLFPGRTRQSHSQKGAWGGDKALGRLCHHVCAPAASVAGGSFGLASSQAWHQGVDTQNTLLGGPSMVRTLVWPALCTAGRDAANVRSAYCPVSWVTPGFLRRPRTGPTAQMPAKRSPKYQMSKDSFHTFRLSTDGPQGPTDGPPHTPGRFPDINSFHILRCPESSTHPSCPHNP